MYEYKKHEGCEQDIFSIETGEIICRQCRGEVEAGIRRQNKIKVRDYIIFCYEEIQKSPYSLDEMKQIARNILKNTEKRECTPDEFRLIVHYFMYVKSRSQHQPQAN